MYAMFNNCSSLKYLDISNFSIIRNTNLGNMFYGIKNCTIKINANITNYIQSLSLNNKLIYS